MSLADSKYFLHFVHAVVEDPGRRIQALAAETGIPKSTAYRIAQFFRFHSALGKRSADPRRILRLTADLRKDRAVPDLSIRTDDAHGLLDGLSRTRYHLAYATAANAIAHFEPADTSVRIHARSTSDISFLKAFHAPSGRAEFHFYVDDLDRYPAPLETDAGAVCNPTITLADLHSHPRAGAHAEFLDRVLTRAGTLPERP